ncbi:trace amine-associated receptor 365-like [Petromyzon marinus]|uniref:trace amine-associated receptor 365-like n=1 Tax=Petromyzon marinus TaxID=7757 RepID=UPI003F6FE41F
MSSEGHTTGPACSLSHGLNCSLPGHSAHAAAAVAALLAATTCCTVLGNAVVVAAVVTFRQLQTRTNAFTLSLAVADLLVGLLVMPFSATRSLYGCWFFGPTFCKVHTCMDFLFTTSSIFHLCAIAFDRHVAICDPLRYGARVSRRTVTLLVALCWLVALLYVVPIMLGWNLVGIEEEVARSSCPGNCELYLNTAFALTSAACGYYAPMVGMVVAYARVYSVARAQSRRVRAEANRGHGAGECQHACNNNTDFRFSSDERAGGKQKARTSLRREHNATKTLGIIMGVFLVLWLPYYASSIASAFSVSGAIDPVAWDAFFWMGYSNSAINPVLYACFNRSFRAAFRLLLSRRAFKASARRLDLSES